MKKSKLIIIVFLSLGLNSCFHTDPQANTLLGRWQIVRIQSNIKASTADELSYDETLNSTNPLYFQFYSNNRFATNTDLALSKILLSEGNTITGTYSFNDQNNQERLDINIYDAVIDQNIILHFVVSNIDGPNPSLVMNKADYVLSIRDSANNSVAGVKKTLEDYANLVSKANFELFMQKI